MSGSRQGRPNDQGSLRPSSRQGDRLSRSRTPSIDRLLSRAPSERRPICENPPPISPLRRGRSGFRRSFAPRALSRRGARPILVIHGSSHVGERGQAPPVDFCNRYRSTSTTTAVRTPQHPPDGRPSAELFSRAPRLSAGLRRGAAKPTPTGKASCGWQHVRSLSGPRGCQPRGHGPGASIRGAWPRGAASSTTIARGESFAPTRSARTPHVASSPRPRLEVRNRGDAAFAAHRNELA